MKVNNLSIEISFRSLCDNLVQKNDNLILREKFKQTKEHSQRRFTDVITYNSIIK